MEDTDNILHIITDTNTGGAELVLHQFLKEISSDNVSVLSMMTPGPLGPMIEELGIDVGTLGMGAGRRPSIHNLLELRRIAKERAPSLVQGWMYHGNIAASAAACARRRSMSVIWGVHHTITRLENEKPMTRAIIRLSARLSRFADAIIYCSRQSASDHERLGFAPDKTVIIPNGIDCERFKPDPEAGARLRRELGLPESRRIIGFVARFHPMKDHRNLIEAARRLLDRSADTPKAENIHVALIGTGSEEQEADLRACIAEAGLQDRVTLMGLRHDIPALVPGFDIFCLPSAWGEAFPLVVCEAMASGVPCVVTDVGDAAWIVGDTGLVVPKRESEALAKALRTLLELDADAMKARGEAAQRRISSEFPLSKMAASYQDLACSVLAKRANVLAQASS